ncbi:MAG: hypothetical protein JNK76_11985 [Planctomycetales bacterium]|nr:hypothetical protein [Planctomycetales bacterium]MBN8627917.1 hypothetical protein [Planctomycetota bacterium]
MPRNVDDSTVKLMQIPVKATIAERIAEYGARVRKSQAQFAVICLERAFENRESFSDRLTDHFISAIGSAVPATRRLKKRTKTETRIVRLQVPISHDMVVKLEAVGAELNHTAVGAAGWLMEKIVLDEDWIVRAVLNPMVVDLVRWVKGIGTAKSRVGNAAVAEK